MSDVNTILSSVGGSAAVSSALIFLFRNWISERLKALIQHEYDQKLETHKAQLKAQSDIEVERMKSQLQVAATERNVRFSHVFEKTAETLVETYGLLQGLLRATHGYANSIEGKATKSELDEATATLVQDQQKFIDYFYAHQIYMPKRTLERTLDIFNVAQRLSNQSARFARAERAGVSQSQLEMRYETIEKLRVEIPKLMSSLHDEFQAILGIPPLEQASRTTVDDVAGSPINPPGGLKR